MRLDEMQKRAYANAKAKGFHDDPRSQEAALMLILTEVAEAAEEVRLPGFDPCAVRYRQKDNKPEGFGPELADVVIRIGDTAEEFGKQLDATVAVSPTAIWSRQLWIQGDHLGALFELADCVAYRRPNTAVACCFAIAEACGLDLWALIAEKMDFNEGRERMHGKRA